MSVLRTLAVCCDQWPVVASGRPAEAPVAVLHANRVVAVGAAARADGVVVGLRRREAQSRCPSVEIVELDPERDARVFETVMGALESIAPRWEVATPGRCAVPARGPSRFHGGDVALAAVVRRVVAEALGGLPGGDVAGVGVGIADGPRAAAVVAQIAAGRMPAATGGMAGGMPAGAAATGAGCTVVPPGATAAHLARLPVRWIAVGDGGWAGGDGRGRAKEMEDLVGVLGRLGLKNLGRFAALEPTDVLARFGAVGRDAHDFARGAERCTPALGERPPDLRVSAELDPPAERVDQAAFTAKVLADGLHAELRARGAVCTRLLVTAETEVGDRIERLWRHEGGLSAAAVAQRVRWQLEGWLATGRGLGRCRGGVSRIELVPDQVVADDGRQLGFWGGSEAGDRVMRALARVQALLGAEAVTVPEWRGGRAPGQRYRPVPLDTVDLDARVGRDDRPWPGALPSPSPAVLWPGTLDAEVVDAEGRQVRVNGRGALSAPPVSCALAGGEPARVHSWAGPWCVEEHWWDPVAHRRRARLQLVLDRDGGEAHLLSLESGSWWLEASYD